MLPPRQQEIVDFLRRCSEPPSVAEIQAHLKLKSPGTVAEHLKALEGKRVIERLPGVQRNIRLVGWDVGNSLSVPVLGTIPAGFPTDQEQEADMFLKIDAAVFKISTTAKVFGLRVRGDSMVDAGIFEEDYAILELTEPRDGDIVAALIDGDVSLKTYVVRNGEAFLRAENPKYQDMRPVRELVVQGVFRGLVRRANRLRKVNFEKSAG